MAANVFRDSAMSLAQLGLAVFQLKNRSKNPATAHGFKDATKDLTEIQKRDWAGVAIATGVVSGICVVDIDPRNGGDAANAPGPLPPTWESLTGGGGRHLIYRITGPMRSRKLCAGIDLKADGGYIVAPPSIHPETGKAYEWELSNVPGEVPPAMAPAWLTEAAEDAPPTPPMPLGTADPSRLARNTALFLQFGASEGERNARLFAAACDMAGCGFSRGAAEPLLAAAAARCGLEAVEAGKTIASAFAAPRRPAVPVVSIPEHLAVNGAIVPAKTIIFEPETARAQPATPNVADATPNVAGSGRVKPSTPANRVRISNLVDATKEVKGNTIPITLHRSVEVIADEMLAASGGWPKAASGVLFVERIGARGPEVRWLTDTDSVFAWMHERFSVRWGSGGSKRPVQCPTTGAILTAPTKTEFVDTLRETSVERYAAVYSLPHEPKMPGIYYQDVGLPEPTGRHLEEFLAAFNPETELDRSLILAAILTPGWGGAPGTRPLFVITSKHGMGAGKTATARAIGEIWGGIVDLDPDEKWADECKRIMSSDDRMARCFFFDNIQGRFGGRGIEAAITAKRLSGHRMFVGNTSRPNDVTFFATLNGPELSADLAQRAVLIHVGKPKHGTDFVQFYSEYVRAHGLNLVSDCLAALRAQPVALPAGVDDRWQAWTRGVLGRVPNGAEVARLIQERRPAADADAEDRQSWCELIASMCQGCPVGETTAADIHKKATEAKLWQPDKSKSESADRQACLRRAERLLAGSGQLEPLSNGTWKRRAMDATNTVRSRVYGIKIEGASEDGEGGVEGPIVNIPV